MYEGQKSTIDQFEEDFSIHVIFDSEYLSNFLRSTQCCIPDFTSTVRLIPNMECFKRRVGHFVT